MEKREFIPVCTPLLGGNEVKYVTEAVQDGWISSSGSFVTKFEEAFSSYCGVRHGIAVCNGTVAIHLALAALGIGKGDEVIIPSFTMIATAFAVCYTGAMPVFVDADKDTWNIDTTKIEAAITPRTKAIIPVHIFGNPCNMDAVTAIARAHRLFIVEDAAEAHGAEYRGKKTGSFSDIAAFSFFANKNITTGEGGMCITNDDNYDRLCRYYKNVCFPPDGPRTYSHDDIGFNYRMSNLHAAIGLAQTEKADEYRAMRRKNAALYKEQLAGCPGIIFQKDEAQALNVHWMNAVVIDPAAYGHTKDELAAHLKSKGIDTRLLFRSMARQESLRRYGCDCSGSYPVTDWLSENGFYLPSASSLREDDIAYICSVIKEFRK
ncbi:MAG: DegT/DnrJ/EryC1/StrS family aminotransferase [Treponema sp.]|jgi:perosamine synthetase|nr:DegT/DnrJ/EryC1/StrS family aminotransferase [Treponema sp.]